MVHTRACARHAPKSAVAPEAPDNTGSPEPFAITAPEGCILAARRPVPGGLPATAFRSGVRTIRAEATEPVGPITVWRRERREGGGHGDPRDRARDAVRADLDAGSITTKQARDDHGLDHQEDR